MTTQNTANTSPATDAQVVHPGPSKALWDSVLEKSGINPADVAEYNVPGHGSFGAQTAADAQVKLALLARLVPFVSGDDVDLPLAEFAQLVADRCKEDA